MKLKFCVGLFFATFTGLASCSYSACLASINRYCAEQGEHAKNNRRIVMEFKDEQNVMEQFDKEKIKTEDKLKDELVNLKETKIENVNLQNELNKNRDEIKELKMELCSKNLEIAQLKKELEEARKRLLVV